MLRTNSTADHRCGRTGRLVELIGDAVVEPVLNERREVEVRLARVAEVALIADLQLCEPGMYETDASHLGERADLMVLEPAAERLVKR